MSVCVLWGSLEKMVRFGWNFAQLFLEWIPGVFFSSFENFDLWGLGMSFCTKTRLKLWSSLEFQKKVRFNWHFAHLFLGWIPGCVFFIFQKILINWVLGTTFGSKQGQTFGAAWRLQKWLDLTEIIKSLACLKLNLCYLIVNIWNVTIGS